LSLIVVVKIVFEMTYQVSSGTLNLSSSNQSLIVDTGAVDCHSIQKDKLLVLFSRSIS